jgi:hypothetical protein
MRRIIHVATLLTFTLTGSAWGATDDSHLLLGAGNGIAVPSIVFGANPAGYASNSQTKLLITGNSIGDTFDPMGFGAGLYLGNGDVGGGLTYGGLTSGGSGTLTASFGFKLKSIKSAFGISCSMALTGGSPDCTSVGWQLNPDGAFKLGVNLSLGSTLVILAGVGFELSKEFLFVVDTYVPTISGTDLEIAPGIGYRGKKFQLNAGYGLTLASSGGANFLRDGISGGLGVELSKLLHLGAYYSMLGKYAASLTFRF